MLHMNKIDKIAYMQGITDYIRYNTRCPILWRNSTQENFWRKGQVYARRQCLN